MKVFILGFARLTPFFAMYIDTPAGSLPRFESINGNLFSLTLTGIDIITSCTAYKITSLVEWLEKNFIFIFQLHITYYTICIIDLSPPKCKI